MKSPLPIAGILLGACLCLTDLRAEPSRNLTSLRAGWSNQRLVALMRELAREVAERHVVRDPARPTFGMTYEFWNDGKQLQVFGLDSVHDGCWLGTALLVAARADPAGPYAANYRLWHLPFHTRLLCESDRLFSNPPANPTEDHKPLPVSLKGWAPRGWDDGAGFDLITGTRFSERRFEHHAESGFGERGCYFSSSNHLQQDLADFLIQAWLFEPAPAIRDAAKALSDYRREWFGRIRQIECARALVEGDLAGFDHLAASDPGATVFPIAPQAGSSPLAYDDNLAWDYTRAVARFREGTDWERAFSLRVATSALREKAWMDAFRADLPQRPGLFFFDLAPKPVLGTDGSFKPPASARKHLYGARGLQFVWLATSVLPDLRTHAGPWPPGLTGADAVEEFALGAVDTWDAVRRELGCVPSGLDDDPSVRSRWEISDAGNYAHFIRLLAALLLDRQGRTDWTRPNAASDASMPVQ